MTPQEIIEQVESCNNIKVFNNPLIKIFSRLNKANKNALAKELSNNHLSILSEDESVNVLGFLPYLWPVLSVEQKKELSLMVSHLVKEEGVKILALLPSSDMGLIFENFDITKLTWEWRDIQLLLSLFSKEEQKKHIKCYFEPYVVSGSLSDGKLKTLLDPLNQEECFWIFMNMDDDHFMECFAKSDFLFSYLSSKNRVAILKRVSGEAIFSHIKSEFFVFDGFKIFLERFDIEDRKDAILLMKPEHLQQIIILIRPLEKTLKRLPQLDRYDFVKYLGDESLEKIIFYKKGNNSGRYLYEIVEKLSQEHRLKFLMGLDKVLLQKICNSWQIVATIFNILSQQDDVEFLNYIELQTELIFDLYTLEKISTEKRFLFILKINTQKLAEFLNENFLWSIVEVLPNESRFDFLLLILMRCPDVFKKNFIQKNYTDLAFVFIEITELLPKKDQFSFFALFSEQYLRQLYFASVYSHKKVGKKLNNYLWEKAKDFSIIVFPENSKPNCSIRVLPQFLKNPIEPFSTGYKFTKPPLFTPSSLEEYSLKEKFVFLEEINDILLKEFLYRYGLKAILVIFPVRNRFDFILLIQKRFPDALHEIFIRIPESQQAELFIDLVVLLAQQHRFSFFELFSAEFLHESYQTYIQYHEEVGVILHKYLSQKNENASSNNIKLLKPLRSNLPEASALNIPPEILPEVLQDFIELPSIKSEQANSSSAVPKIKRRVPYDDTEKLNVLIDELQKPQYKDLVYQNLLNALIELSRVPSWQYGVENEQKRRKAIRFTVSFLEEFLPETNPDEKIRIIKAYEDKVQPLKTLKTIGKCLGAVIIAALCTFCIISFGVGIGVLAGSWTGPGAIVTGVLGLVGGISALPVIVGACLASYKFFKSSPLQNATNNIIRSSKNIKEEDIALLGRDNSLWNQAH